MHRICKTLSDVGYHVNLIGRSTKASLPLQTKKYKQKRLRLIFKKGKLFYLEYNIRIFLYLLFKKMDGICAIDLDTIIPCYYISKVKKIPRVYDAHELFCEMKEVVSRPIIFRIWKSIEKKYVPSFESAYTVNHLIANEFKTQYGINFETIRNIAPKQDIVDVKQKEKFILYQGAVNEGRCFETLLPAMRNINARLIICGTGNYLNQAKSIVNRLQLNHKIKFLGNLLPDKLSLITQKSYIGITLFENQSKNNFWSLGNRFFDYIQAGTPQICVNYPIYYEMNKIHSVAVLIDETSEESISNAINELLNDNETWELLYKNCKLASKDWNWQNEQTKLVNFYNKIFG
jgi:glycosyltransferase involved in cell wall biosynthesis